MAKIINLQKVQKSLNDPLMMDFFRDVEEMKNPPKEYRGNPEVEAIVSVGNMLDRAAKKSIMDYAVEEV